MIKRKRDTYKSVANKSLIAIENTPHDDVFFLVQDFFDIIIAEINDDDIETKSIYQELTASISTKNCTWEKIIQCIDLASIPPTLNSACVSGSIKRIVHKYAGKEICENLKNHILERSFAEKTICSFLTSDEAKKYARNIAHLTREQICLSIQNVISELNLQPIEKFSANSSVADMLDVMSNISLEYRQSKNIFTEEYKSHLAKIEAFTSAIQFIFSRNANYNLKEKITSPVICAPKGFIYCAKCWRMLPERNEESGSSRCCEWHNYDPLLKSILKDSQKIGTARDLNEATRICEILFADTNTLPPLIHDCLSRLRATTKAQYGNVKSSTWHLNFSEHLTEQTIVKSLPTIIYDLNSILQNTPYVADFVEYKVGMTVRDILKKLNPPTHDECDEEKALRKIVHLFFEKNFYFYFYDLAFAEAWLSIYKTIVCKNTHGGKRQNSGRKSKKQY